MSVRQASTQTAAEFAVSVVTSESSVVKRIELCWSGEHGGYNLRKGICIEGCPEFFCRHGAHAWMAGWTKAHEGCFSVLWAFRIALKLCSFYGLFILRNISEGKYTLQVTLMAEAGGGRTQQKRINQGLTRCGTAPRCGFFVLENVTVRCGAVNRVLKKSRFFTVRLTVVWEGHGAVRFFSKNHGAVRCG